MTLVAGTAWAYWTADSTAGGNGAAAATSVNQGATPSGSASGQAVTVSWAATTLANGQPVGGYLIKRFDAVTLVQQTINSACAGVVATTSCVEANVPGGSWRYSVTPVIGSNWAGAESTRSSPVVVVAVDITPPTNNLSLSSVTGGAYLNGGTTLWYRGTAAGSFTLTNAVADAGSGPASSQTAALTGTSTGWTPHRVDRLDPAGGPYVSNTFSWGAGTTSRPGEAVTGRDVASNAAATKLTFTNDSTAPTAGSVSYTDGFAAGRSVDASASRPAPTRVRASPPGSCSVRSATLTGGYVRHVRRRSPTSAPAQPDVAVRRQLARCTAPATSTATSSPTGSATSTSPPAPTSSRSTTPGRSNATSGLLSHWRLGEASATLTSSDPMNGTTGAGLTTRSGEVGASWTHDLGTNNETISAQGQAYRNGSGYGIYYTSGVPASADYSVEADLVYKSNLTGEMAGVIGRFDTTNNDFYMARWEEADNSWNIVQYDSGAVSYPAFVANQPDLVVGHDLPGPAGDVRDQPTTLGSTSTAS